ncbi:GNAT family N-acetyltransferase [Gemmobacter denitrificans]|uniref:L-ornithine N(alpha)-acyltransferase n=1 Tax=Gemmobacter denitrificans TaxID=3123040 RepID=A0ABU8BQ32_9RHOB
MEPLVRGHYRARLAQDTGDVAAAQRLRHLCFHGREGVDADRFDDLCDHVLIEDVQRGDLVCCYRLLPLGSGAALPDSYAGQFYDLGRLTGFSAPLLELGRFCCHPSVTDPDVLRLAWGAMTRRVDHLGIGLLFGCASFSGTDPAPLRPAFAQLAAHHLAPPDRAPQPKAPETYAYAQDLAGQVPDARQAARLLPPLLRTYLGMGGWVSDHAVIDRQMGTLHVFTGVEIAAIPPARSRALRMVAGG